jgi:dinuclear metal center YbgI/SA1388 family protein
MNTKIKTEQVLHVLEEKYPASYAMSWDNPGLQVGRKDRPVKKVYVALDATQQVIEECIAGGADLLVTHHPLLMSGIKKINSEEFPGCKALQLIENGIAHFAIHTNYDVLKMAQLAEEALKLADLRILEETCRDSDGKAYGIGSVGTLPEKMTAGRCCAYVKEAFGLADVRLFGDPETEIATLAVSPGSGKSMIDVALASGADLLVTGDIGHHDGLDAVDQGLLVIDAGHYGTEHLFIRQMADDLRKEFPELEICEAAQEAPFAVM